MRNNMRVTPLSEGIVPLSRSHDGPGVLVHQERGETDEQGAFVTIRSAPCWNMDQHQARDDVQHQNKDSNTARIIVGRRSTALAVDLLGGVLCTNLWVHAGEEVWISATHAGTMCVYGHATPMPL